MIITHKNKGTCSRSVTFEVTEDNTIKNVSFDGGCNGNAQGVSNLVEGLKVEDVIKKLDNIDCNGRGTSCPAQLANALKEL